MVAEFASMDLTNLTQLASNYLNVTFAPAQGFFASYQQGLTVQAVSILPELYCVKKKI